MREPVLADDGYCYERLALLSLAQNSVLIDSTGIMMPTSSMLIVSPITGQLMSNSCKPCRTLKLYIEEYLAKYPEEIHNQYTDEQSTVEEEFNTLVELLAETVDKADQLLQSDMFTKMIQASCPTTALLQALIRQANDIVQSDAFKQEVGENYVDKMEPTYEVISDESDTESVDDVSPTVDTIDHSDIDDTNSDITGLSNTDATSKTDENVQTIDITIADNESPIINTTNSLDSEQPIVDATNEPKEDPIVDTTSEPEEDPIVDAPIELEEGPIVDATSEPEEDPTIDAANEIPIVDAPSEPEEGSIVAATSEPGEVPIVDAPSEPEEDPTIDATNEIPIVDAPNEPEECPIADTTCESEEAPTIDAPSEPQESPIVVTPNESKESPVVDAISQPIESLTINATIESDNETQIVDSISEPSESEESPAIDTTKSEEPSLISYTCNVDTVNSYIGTTDLEQLFGYTGFDLNTIHIDFYNCTDNQILTHVISNLTAHPTDLTRCTPLHSACIKGNLKLANLLIANEPDHQCTNCTELTIMHAVHSGNLELVQFLTNLGYNVTDSEMYYKGPLHYAIAKNNLELAKIVVKNQPLNFKDYNHNTPLCTACIDGNYYMAQMLIDAGADPEFTDGFKDYGLKPIHYACYYGHANIVVLLEAHSVDIDSMTPNRMYPIELALKNNHTEVVDLMIKFGATIPQYMISG
jgi:hypothetical protein